MRIMRMLDGVAHGPGICAWEGISVSEHRGGAGRRAGLGRWGEAERLRLRAARDHAGHSMERCAEILRSEFGVAAVSQSNLSRWESGAIGLPQCVRELLAYCDAYGLGAAVVPVGSQGEPADRVTARYAAIAASQLAPVRDDAEADTFEMLAADAAGEPLLGTAQLELIRGMSRRLERGPPLSQEDRATYLDQLRILRVPGGSGG